MDEKKLGHGVSRRNPLVKRVQKLSRRLRGRRIAGAGIPFNWNVGFDVRDTIGAIKIKNQGSSESCGGQAGAYFLEIQRKLQNIMGGFEGAISAKSIYAPWRRVGGGMTVTELNTQIGAHGANLEATVPSYDINGNPLTESMMTDMSWSTPRLLNDAMTRAGYTPYDIAENFETVAQTIRDRGAVLMEIRGTDNNTWLTSFPSINRTGNPFWYHYICFLGAKIINNKKYLIGINSWGNIGDKGCQYFGEEWFTSKNIIDAFTFIHDSQLIPLPSAQPTIWQALALWFRNQWKLASSLT